MKKYFLNLYRFSSKSEFLHLSLAIRIWLYVYGGPCIYRITTWFVENIGFEHLSAYGIKTSRLTLQVYINKTDCVWHESTSI